MFLLDQKLVYSYMRTKSNMMMHPRKKKYKAKAVLICRLYSFMFIEKYV